MRGADPSSRGLEGASLVAEILAWPGKQRKDGDPLGRPGALAEGCSSPAWVGVCALGCPFLWSAHDNLLAAPLLKEEQGFGLRPFWGRPLTQHSLTVCWESAQRSLGLTLSLLRVSHNISCLHRQLSGPLMLQGRGVIQSAEPRGAGGDVAGGQLEQVNLSVVCVCAHVCNTVSYISGYLTLCVVQGDLELQIPLCLY